MRQWMDLLNESLSEAAGPFDGIVYHCSNDPIEKFRLVSPKRGIYFANEPDNDYGIYTYKCRVKLKHAMYALSGDNFEIDRKTLIDRGYDGRIVDYKEESDHEMYDVIAFYPGQIQVLEVTKREITEESESDIQAQPHGKGVRYSTEGGHIDVGTGYASPRKQSIVSFHVDEDKQGKGIGRRLLNHVLTLYDDIGAQVSGAASLKLFYDAGFRNPNNPTGTLADYEQQRQDHSSIFMAQRDRQGRPLTEDAAPRRITKAISPEVTSAAAAEGFDTSKVWYHGSRRSFRSFREPNEKGINELGVGVYLTSGWNYANTWAKTGGYVYECYIRKGEIFDYSKNMTDEAIRRAHKGHSEFMDQRYGADTNSSYSYDDFVKHILSRSYIQTLSGNRFAAKFLKWAGYVGAVDPTSQIPGQIVVFNPADVFVAARGAGGHWGDRD